MTASSSRQEARLPLHGFRPNSVYVLPAGARGEIGPAKAVAENRSQPNDGGWARCSHISGRCLEPFWPRSVLGHGVEENVIFALRHWV